MNRHAQMILSTSLLIGLSLCSAFADEPPITGKMIAAIQSAAVLPQGDKVLVTTAGKEAAVSTFRTAGANVRDCKIDAALIAKALMVDNSFGLARVRVQFHEPAGTSHVMQEVSVSLAEVKGFAAGTVTKEEFLESLEVKSLPEASAAEPPKAALQEPASTETVAGTTLPGGAEEKPLPAVATKIKTPVRQRLVSKRTGISFSVPVGWTLTEAASGATVFALKSQRTNQENIELRFNVDGAAQTPALRAQLQRAKFNYPGVSIKRYLPATNFGTGPYPGSMLVCTYPNYDDNERQYYEMYLNFGNYTLHGWCGITAYSTVGAAFDEIVRSITFPTKAKGNKK